MAFVLTAYNDVHKFSHSYLSCTPSFISSYDDVIFKHDVSQVVIYWRENSKTIFKFDPFDVIVVQENRLNELQLKGTFPRLDDKSSKTQTSECKSYVQCLSV